MSETMELDYLAEAIGAFKRDVTPIIDAVKNRKFHETNLTEIENADKLDEKCMIAWQEFKSFIEDTQKQELSQLDLEAIQKKLKNYGDYLVMVGNEYVQGEQWDQKNFIDWLKNKITSFLGTIGALKSGQSEEQVKEWIKGDAAEIFGVLIERPWAKNT